MLLAGSGNPETSTDGMIFNVLMLVFYALVTWQISAGRIWARLMYAFLVAFEFALLAAFGLDSASDLDVLTTCLTTPVELWALYKLFRSESDAWFKSVGQAVP